MATRTRPDGTLAQSGPLLYWPDSLVCRCGATIEPDLSAGLRPAFQCAACGVRYVVTIVIADPPKDAAWQSRRPMNGGGA